MGKERRSQFKPATPQKPMTLVWIAGAEKEMKRLPYEAQAAFLHMLQRLASGRPLGAVQEERVKQLVGLTKGKVKVMQCRKDMESGSYRCVYARGFATVLPVLACFQKKARKGSKHPKDVSNLIKTRRDSAIAEYTT